MKRRKGLAFILALSLVLSSFSVAFATDVAEETTPVTETTTEAVAPVATATNTAFADIAGHWAKDAIVKWADYGVVKGSDGVFRPDAPLTRAEMATVLSNLMDYKVAAKNNFSDVATGAWYADAVLKANAAGVLSGDGSGLASPSANITREQATSMLARAFAVADANGTSSSLTDTQNISSWARPAVFGMEAAGYVRGFEGKFNPKNNITRAEVMTIINSAVKAYYTAAGTYTENVDGLAVVKVPGVVLKDVVISGNLIAAEGIASGDLTLDGKTEVKGKLIVRGGGENSIIIKGSAAVLSIEVSKVDGKVRIFADGALIKEIDALNGEIILEGNFINVAVKADATVIIKGNVETLSIESKGAVDIQSGTVTTLDIPAGATATVAANATVTTANITGAADIKGTGAIGTANISGTGATIVQTPTAVNVADGGAATVGGKTVDGATSAAPSTGGGRGNSSNTVAVSAISVDKTTLTLTAGGATGTITATVSPAGATNKNVTWTSSNIAVATVADGVVTPKTAGTTTITATTVDGGFAKTISVTVTAATYTVTVNGGTGSGSFAKDAVVTITATVPTGKVFDKWTTSDGVAFANVDNATTTFTMPAKAVTVTATYKDVAPSAIATPAIAGVTAPVYGATPVAAIADTTEYTATIAWNDSPTTFAASTVYTATITITPKAGYTLTGVSANFFTVAGATATNAMNTGVVTAVFPATGAINKSELTTAISTANTNKNTAVVSTDGKDVLPANMWVTSEVMGAYETAISTAQGIVDKAVATQEEVNTAVTNLFTATSVFNTAKKAGIKVVVTDVTLDKSTLSLVAGGATGTLVATVNPTEATNKNVTWSSSDTGVATVVNGVVTPVSAGSTTITVTTVDGSYTATANVTVTAIPVLGTLSPTVTPGDGKIVLSAMTPETGYAFYYKKTAATDEANKPALDSAVSSDWAVFTSNTDITGTNGTKIFVQVIKVATDGAKIKAWGETSATPANVPVTGVTLNQTAMDLKVGTGTGTLTATIAPANATNKTVTWESSVPTIATVDSNGKVTPVATGTTTITVTTADGSKTATCTVTVTAANIANAVLVGGNGEANTLKSDFPYWVNGARSKTGTLGSEGCTAFFDHLTGILTLHGYNGGEIKSSFASEPDLIIKLIGTNKVTTLSQVGIENGYSGNIYITAENDASLEINSDSTENSYGIATGHISGNSAGSVVIGGKAKVTIDAETTGTSNTAIGISAKNDVTIHENADLTIITKTAGFFDNEGIFAGNNITINTTKNIAIDLSTNTKGLVLSRSTIINNVNLMTLKAPTDGEFIFGTPDLSGVAVNIAGKVASYRSGTPYTLKVKNGEITGVAAGVFEAGQQYQALANDTITIKSKTIPLFEFVKWMDAEGNDLDASLFTGGTTASSPEATIKMPAKDLNIKAEYKSILFVTQPSFHRGDAKVTWEISQAANGYLQKKNVGVWEGFDTSITSDIGVGNKVISSSQQPDGTYRLKFVFGTGFEDFDNHYSNEFEIKWYAQLDGTVTISGTPKYGETLTANVTGTQPDAGELKYQWYAGTDKIGTNSNELAPTTAHIGKTIKVAVSSHNYNLPIESAATVAVAKADGPAAIDSYTGTSEVETNIKLAGLGASTPNLEVAVAIDGSTYDEYGNLFVDGDGKASIFGLTGVNASTKVKVRIKESPTHFAGADREITVTVATDTTPPVITATDKIVPIANLAAWTEPVSANDNFDGNITAKVVATYFESNGTTSLTDLAAAKEYIGDASVNTSFIIKYNVSDAAGNAATEVVVTITVTEANVPSSMTVGSSILNSTNPYLVDGTPATTGTLGVGKCTAHFDPITGVLSLQDYVGGKIHINEAGKDLRIKLIGNANKITGGQFGIHNDKGDIHVTSDSVALLEIEINSSSDGAAIANGWGAMTENPSVFIGGKVKLTIKAKYTGEQTTNHVTGIYAGKGSVTIEGQADYSATITNSKNQGRGIRSSSKTIINTSGNIEIDVSNSVQGVGIYGNSGIEIQQVNSMLITIPSTGGTNTKFTSGTVDVSSGVAVNKSTTKASYRSGTPYTLGLEGGNITSATGGVIGSPHQYLVDDEITIESTISNFDRWTKADGTALETSLFTGSDTAESATATIKMPAANLSIKAKEKDAKISIAEIPGVTAPVTGATPVTTEVSTDQYTGTVAWSPTDNPFAAEKVYTATITLKAKSGFTLDGVAANFFTVAGATTVTNAANTGVVAAVFAKTVALSNDAALTSSIGTVDNTANTIVDVPYATTLEVFKAAITPATGATFKVYQADGTTEATDLASGYKVIVTAQDTTTTKTYTVTVEIGEFAGGLGTVGSPYQVSNAEQLNKVRNHLDKHFIQTADIDLSTYTTYGGWQPIGNTTTKFAGKYNGNNFNISNLTINRPDAGAQGLFGDITYGSVLENISLITVNVKGNSNVGGLVGIFTNGTITSCNVLGTVNGKDYVGGLVGRQSFGTITSSYTLGTVNGTDIVGGLVGSMGSGSDVKVTNSYSLASVTATTTYGRVGGLVGLNQKAIENCYAAGQVTGTNAGGLVGENKGTITSSYYDSENTGQSDTGKGDGKTTAEMKNPATFTGWVSEIWEIVSGSYPTLR